MEAVEQMAVSNSHLEDKTDRRPVVEEWGIDTWRPVRYLDDDDDLRRAVRYLDGRTFQKVEGHAVGVLPDRRMLWAEGHPAVDGLAAPKTLLDAQRRLLRGLRDVGLPVGRDGGLRRFDSTVTLRFDDPLRGLAFLRGLAAVDVPRMKKAVYEGSLGHPETVYLLGPGRSRRVLGRGYDKGVESGEAVRGTLVRLECQTRLPGEVGEYFTPELMTEHDQLVGAHFERRFAPVALSADGVHVGTAPALADRLAKLASEGRVSAAKAERLAGYLLVGERLDRGERTRRRRRAELREFGLIVGDPARDSVDVDLGEPLDAALAAWSSGS